MMKTTLLLVLWFSIAYGAFDVAPLSQEVSSGSQAEFRCQHPTAFIIIWRVNGSLVGRNPPPDIIPGITRDDNGNLVDTLTLTARPEYNGTVVVCVARFNDGSPDEQTQPVRLIVLVNASAMDNTRFLLHPMSLNVTVDAVAVFHCQHLTADGINWKINGSTLRDFPVGISTDRDDNIFTLTIMALPEYNKTVVECVALFADSPSIESRSEMMIQGNLDNVTNLDRSTSTLSWIPPFSLNLTSIEPDIIYCVDIYNITCGRRDLIISDCNVTEPSYTLDDIAPHGYIYEYIVTPRSNVPGARNGTPSQPLKDQFITFSVNSPRLKAEVSSLTYEAELTYNMESNQQLPFTYTLLLKSLDGLDDDVETITYYNRSDGSVIFNVPNLPPRRLWKYAILANGCQNDSVLVEEPELSTHDVQNISIVSPRSESITVDGDFIQGSTATGILIITIKSNNNAQYHLYHRKGNKVQIEDTMSGLAGGDYKVSAFVFEGSGYPFNRTATEPKSVFVMTGSESEPSSTILYNLHPNSTHVCVTCTFMSSTPTSCLAVVHQRTNSRGLMTIESSHRFNRSDDTAYGCIQTNLDDHQVGVVDGRLVGNVPQDGSSSVCIGCIAGSVPVLVVFVLSTLVLVAVLLIYQKTFKKDSRPQDDVEAPTMEEGYTRENARENFYERIPSSMPNEVEQTRGENMPLMSTIEPDGQAENISQTSPISSLTSSTAIPQAAVAGLTGETIEPTKIVYDEVKHQPNPGFPAPQQGDEPQYSTVNKFKNAQGLVYACHVVKPPSTATQQVILDDSTKTTSQYSEIIHPPNCQEKAATTTTSATTLNDKLERPTSPFDKTLLPGQTEEICTEGSPTCNVTTCTQENRLKPPPRERIDSNRSSGCSTGNGDDPISNSSNSSNTSDGEDEGYSDAGNDEHSTRTQKVPMQPIAQDVPKQDSIVHVHNSGPKVQPKNLKEPVTFQHLDHDSPEQRKVHGQCEDDVDTITSTTNDSCPNNEVAVTKNPNSVVAPTEKKHHHVTVDENQDGSVRKSFSTKVVVSAHMTSHSEIKDFAYEQDNYYEVSLGSKDHENTAGDDEESSYMHCIVASSTLQLTNYEYTLRLRQLADKVNVGECLWQIRAQALSQEGSEIHLSDNAKPGACLDPETVLNKRFRVDKRNKLRINFQRLQEITR